eukprot:4301559-Pleurochrysis_carterae.AAC.2
MSRRIKQVIVQANYTLSERAQFLPGALKGPMETGAPLIGAIGDYLPTYTSLIIAQSARRAPRFFPPYRKMAAHAAMEEIGFQSVAERALALAAKPIRNAARTRSVTQTLSSSVQPVPMNLTTLDLRGWKSSAALSSSKLSDGRVVFTDGRDVARRNTDVQSSRLPGPGVTAGLDGDCGRKRADSR